MDSMENSKLRMKRRFKTVLASIRRTARQHLPTGAKVLLYGSRARGDAREDSDWDILILLDKDRIEKSDHDTISYPLRVLGYDMGEYINPTLYTFKEWAACSFTPYHKNVEEDGIVLL